MMASMMALALLVGIAAIVWLLVLEHRERQRVEPVAELFDAEDFAEPVEWSDWRWER